MIEGEFTDHVIVTMFCAPLTWLWCTVDSDVPQCDVMFFVAVHRDIGRASADQSGGDCSCYAANTGKWKVVQVLGLG